MECQYCKNMFSTKFLLSQHQTKAKYCLSIQGISVSEKNENKYECKYCNKTLCSNDRLRSHFETCKEKLKNEYHDQYDKLKNEYNIQNEQIKQENEKEQQQLRKVITEQLSTIAKLELMLEKANETIVEIAKQPKTINHSDNRVQTSVTNNRFDINDITKIGNVLDHHLTPDVMRRGQEGIAEMLKTHLLQTENGEPIYECTDVARQKFEFRNADGNIETDPKATKLIRNLGRSGIWNKAHATGKKLWEKDDGSVNYDAQHVFMPHVTEVLEIDKNSTKLRNRLASITARQPKTKSK